MSFGTKGSQMKRGRIFWACGYCISTIGLDEEKIREYIRNQEQLGLVKN
jgi:putative transposase